MIAAGTCAKNATVGQVAEEYERLIKAVSELQEVAGRLLDKLDPILTREQPRPGGECDAPIPDLCPLASALRDQRFRMENTTNLIFSINARVEL